MNDEMKELLQYRLNRAQETLEVAKALFEDGKYRDANNRSYYAEMRHQLRSLFGQCSYINTNP